MSTSRLHFLITILSVTLLSNASLYIPRNPSLSVARPLNARDSSGVIKALLRARPKHHEAVNARATGDTCDIGYAECADGSGCCPISYYCGVFGGEPGCCPDGELCSGAPDSCVDSTDHFCAGGGCCSASQTCCTDSTGAPKCCTGGSGGGGGGSGGSGGSGGGSSHTTTKNTFTATSTFSTSDDDFTTTSDLFGGDDSTTTDLSFPGGASTTLTTSTRRPSTASVTSSSDNSQFTGLGSSNQPASAPAGISVNVYWLTVCILFISWPLFG